MIVKITIDKIEPMCMVIGRSHAIREIAENYPDISYFCGDKIRGGEKYNLNGHSVLTESADSLSVFDKKVTKITVFSSFFFLKTFAYLNCLPTIVHIEKSF